MDFILAILEIDKYNITLIITDLWLKKVTIGAGKDIWGA